MKLPSWWVSRPARCADGPARTRATGCRLWLLEAWTHAGARSTRGPSSRPCVTDRDAPRTPGTLTGGGRKRTLLPTEQVCPLHRPSLRALMADRRALRVCGTPGCPNFQPCALHRRPSAHARGYDREHRSSRTDWARLVARGTVLCRRCHVVIGPCEPWDLGHPDAECPAPRAPEHQRCNRAAAGRSAHSA